MKLSIVIVTWNSAGQIEGCLSSLRSLQIEHEIWVVDNDSHDGTLGIVSSKFPSTRVIENRANLGFARANNQALERTASDYILLLNPDTVVPEGALEQALIELEARSRAGMLGVRLLNPDMSLQPSCFRFPSPWFNFLEQIGLHKLLPVSLRGRFFLSAFWDHGESRSVDWIMGAFMLIRRSVIEIAGLVPEPYFMYAEDLDWCYQLRRKGFEVWFTKEVSVIHAGNKSAGQLASRWAIEKRADSKYIFCRRAYGRVGAKLIELTDLVAQTIRTPFYRLKASRDPGFRMALETVKISRASASRSFFGMR
jgi:GT2 family glycosyltransferase